MYTVYAYNFIGTVSREWNFLEKGYAEMTFRTAARCMDCKLAQLIDAMTSEIIMEYEHGKEIQVF